MRKLALTLFRLSICVLGLTAFSEATERSTFKITHVSADHVYIDGGSTDSLAVGDSLEVQSTSRPPVVLEIVYVARHSASCRMVSGHRSPGVNEMAVLTSKAEKSAGIEEPAIETSESAQNPVQEVVRQYIADSPPSRVSGNVSIIFSDWIDNSRANLGYSQSTARLNLKAERLWGRDVTFVMRSRGRYDDRARSYRDIGQSEWENRLWEMSVTYAAAEEKLVLSAGRFLPRRLIGVGYLDGGLIDLRLTNALRAAAFGGQQPDWLYHDVDDPVKRAGAYVSYDTPGMHTAHFEQSLGFVGEYVNGEASRTFLAESGSIRYGNIAGLTHFAEIDINSGWRMDKTGSALVVSNLYTRAHYRISRSLRLAVNYDNRKNYWTHNNRSMADSLFDDRTRQGVRGTVTVSPARSTWISGGIGYRKRSGDTDAFVTYSGSVRQSGLLSNRLSAGIYATGFDGPYEYGLNYALRTQLLTGTIGVVSAAYGRYLYAVDGNDDTRSSHFVESGLNADIGSHYYTNGMIQYNTGDDIDGWRLQLEFGYRY
jgi:hypothetical protein